MMHECMCWKQITQLTGFVNSVFPLQVNTSNSSSSRLPCRSLEETHDSTSSVPGGSRFGCWLLTASANSTMVWTDWKRYRSFQLNSTLFLNFRLACFLTPDILFCFIDFQLKEFANFDFDVWRKKYMRWMNHKKSRVMDFFRRIDKDQDGKITRQEFIDGILASSGLWLTKCLVMKLPVFKLIKMLMMYDSLLLQSFPPVSWR